jgi:hypothetical protein
MSLVTYEDLMAPSKSDPLKSVAAVSLARMQSASMPMPPSGPLTSAQALVLANWIVAGTPKGTCAAGTGGTTGAGGAAGTGGATAAGGATGTGGATGIGGTGGAAGVGGATGTGGAVGVGGATGTGGAAGVGGATGTGGRAGTGGTTGTGGATGTGGTAGTEGSTADAGGDAGSCIAAKTPRSGGMNTGQACLGCHNVARGGQQPFKIAGTVYAGATSTTGVAGATVTITDNNQAVTTIVTSTAGNFWATNAFAFPVKVSVSKCPDTVSMPTTASSGDCNSCHTSGTRIHLP